MLDVVPLVLEEREHDQIVRSSSHSANQSQVKTVKVVGT
jgi:hypothetical protein